jgi:hypothetical protein
MPALTRAEEWKPQSYPVDSFQVFRTRGCHRDSHFPGTINQGTALSENGSPLK